MGGLELCQRVRQDAATKDIVLVVVTGEGSEQTEAALDAGCDAVIEKPCCGTLLITTIRRIRLAKH